MAELRPDRDDIRARIFADSLGVKRQFLREQVGPLVAAIDAIMAALRAGNKLLLFGNGGSAADAQSHRCRVRRLLQNRAGAGAGDRIHRGAGGAKEIRPTGRNVVRRYVMKYECPRCHQPGIPAWRRWSLGPATPTVCLACGGRVGVPWSSTLSVLPFLVGILLSATVDSSIGSATCLLVGAAGMFLLYWWIAPLVPR